MSRITGIFFLLAILISSISRAQEEEKEKLFQNEKPFFSFKIHEKWQEPNNLKLELSPLIFKSLFRYRNLEKSAVIKVGQTFHLGDYNSIWEMKETGKKQEIKKNAEKKLENLTKENGYSVKINNFSFSKEVFNGRKVIKITYKSSYINNGKRIKTQKIISYRYLIKEKENENIIFFHMTSKPKYFKKNTLELREMLYTLIFKKSNN